MLVLVGCNLTASNGATTGESAKSSILSTESGKWQERAKERLKRAKELQSVGANAVAVVVDRVKVNGKAKIF